MLDFVKILTRRSPKKGIIEVYPEFRNIRSKDLMIKGGKFYAIWDEEVGLWSTDEYRAHELIDNEIKAFYEEFKKTSSDVVIPLYIWNDDSGSIDKWIKYTQKHLIDNYHHLDSKLTFSNDEVKKESYASRRLSYPLQEGDCSAYSELIGTLYSPAERHKIEWAIGAIVTGESQKLQKFEVFYGSAGTGKSTILNIIQELFDGYYAVFDAKALGSSTNSFALEPFRTNPLVAIQHDGDLSKIEDNTRLNSIVSHEEMTVNEKYMTSYTNRFNCFLFMGTNRPVKITDAKSGIIRRLIDVSPSGEKIPFKRYLELTNRVSFELGAIAWHCKEVFLEDPHYYDNYIPTTMLGASNDFYNFVLDSIDIFEEQDSTTLKAAWEMYKTYCSEANVAYPYSKRLFQEELKNYFKEFTDRARGSAGNSLRNVYTGFLIDKFVTPEDIPEKPPSLKFDCTESLFDREYAEAAAQYANDEGTPYKSWKTVRTKLKDIDTHVLHYVKLPENHIVIDFDLKNKEGEKSYRKNLEAASKWPLTYAELSKSGAGIHLHYIYDGDVNKLQRLYEEGIEIKVFTGNSSLRRKLTKCNDIPIRTINSGLPLKGETKMVDFEALKSEKALRSLIIKNLKKEVHPNTKPSVDFIYKLLEDAYNSGLKYDVSDLHSRIFSFAAGSSHNSEYCIKLVTKMKFKSEEPSDGAGAYEKDVLIFYDVEVFPNLFVVVYKAAGKDPVKLIDPTPQDIEKLASFKLVGFNCRRYDNHIMYARLMGYSNEQLYVLSQRIIAGNKNVFFGEAYNLSYTDIYDFASAGNKKSLKKLEIEMGIHHQELGLRWDQPVPEDLWDKVADYCVNDVVATEAAFHYLSADWMARQILADLAGMTVNDTTNSLTTRIIFGRDRNPQNEFNYRNLAEPVFELTGPLKAFLKEACPEMMDQRHGEAKSLLPYFPGYSYDHGVSTYRGEEVGEGGYVYAEPGMYTNVALLDVSSMHPHSAIAECLFGIKYTRAFREIVEGRVSIKHQAWEEVDQMLDGKLKPYIQKVKDGEIKASDLANALKTAINSVYGLTAARFSNAFRDPRNVDNIVAKRGALFMIDLKHEVQKRGFTVAHIKTDSIKIPNATPEIIEFVMNFGKKYGYSFEHEATYEKMCLVNDAVYIAKYRDGGWTATGAQFAVPYVFKTLFSHEPIEFKDLCETKTVTSALYLDMNEGLPEGEHDYHFVGKAGLFCPIMPGCGGGELLRESGEDKYASATGAKGYRWLESEMVQLLGKEDTIDISYYKALVDGAVEEISKYGDFEWFVSNDPVAEVRPDFMNIPEGFEESGVPFN